MDNYQWFGSNRKDIHRRAVRSSGGVGFFIHDRIMKTHTVTTLDDSYDGILWIKLSHKTTAQVFTVCVCYLPPCESSRSQPTAFFDHLLSLMYQYQNLGPYFIVGDFNSRCANDLDYIAGVDTVPERHVVDYTSNMYGRQLINFLIDCNCCIVNGRNTVKNDFTCFGPNGSSVVDYCICPQEHLEKFSDFQVLPMHDLMDNYNIEPPVVTPDHAILRWSWSFVCQVCDGETATQRLTGAMYRKYDVTQIDRNFLSSSNLLDQVNQRIENIQHVNEVKDQLNGIYEDFSTIMKSHMDNTLPYKDISSPHSYVKSLTEFCRGRNERTGDMSRRRS